MEPCVTRSGHSGGRKRRRSSVENDIMEKRLQAWRAKKGLPIRSKVQEERDKRPLLSEHTTPNHQSKRKMIQMSKSEKIFEKGEERKKQPKFYTPGPSTSNNAAFNSRHTCTGSKINKQPGRRSLAPSTRMNTLQQKDVSRNDHRKLPADKKMPSHPNKSDRTTTALPQKNIIRSHDPSHLHKRSVRFTSPNLLGSGEPVDENVLATVATLVTPVQTKTKLDMKERLDQWLIAKGKTPRFHNFLGYESSMQHTPSGNYQRRRSCTPHHGKDRRDTPWKSTQTTDGAPGHDTMKECLEMLEEGCPLEVMSIWLDAVVTKAPLIQQCAGYWLCRAKIAEKRSGDQAATECLFEAAEFNPEPSKDILDTLATYRLKLKMSLEEGSEETGANSPLRHSPCLEIQTPVAHLGFEDEDLNQSYNGEGGERPGDSHLSIKYSLKESTPYFARIHQTTGDSPPTSCLLVTPVRRSARLENKRHSVACLGTQHTRTPAVEDCMDSMSQVAANFPSAQLILRPNRALNEEFSQTHLQD
ncbi:cytoskeleton-associated protein 2-like [Lytechinus variegatus]|uniref:cytoskeleton-associated protein 2-like n=1 Tax=Lytechinus variegatus TaxID=7654 RepID=UPI001BB206B2|nr:cytoskeleton-associated protein 2-like [Lytechinus variegatus]